MAMKEVTSLASQNLSLGERESGNYGQRYVTTSSVYIAQVTTFDSQILQVRCRPLRIHNLTLVDKNTIIKPCN
jgi:hypothetical protein